MFLLLRPSYVMFMPFCHLVASASQVNSFVSRIYTMFRSQVKIETIQLSSIK